VPVYNGKKELYWDMIIGYVGNNNDLYHQIDDEYVGWNISDAVYFKHIKYSDLPPLPEPPKS